MGQESNPVPIEHKAGVVSATPRSIEGR